MKKLLILTLLISFIGIDISAQTWTPVNGRQRFVSGIGIPVRDTLSPNAADTSQMVIRPQDGVLYYRRTGAWIRASAQDLSNYVTIDGLQTITGAKIFNPTLTASGKMARSVLINGLLTAALDSDTLVGLDIQPTFNLNSKASVQRRWLRVGGRYDDSSFSFIKLSNNGVGTNTGGSVEWPFNQRIQGTFSEGLRFYNKNGTDYWTATASSISWTLAPTLSTNVNNGEFNLSASVGTSSKIIHTVGGYHSFKVYTAPATFTEMVRINSSGLNALNLAGTGTRMATISSTGLFGVAALPYTTGYIDSNFLPLTAGISKPLTGTLYGAGVNMTNDITANTFIKATGTASQIMLADGSVLDKTNIYTGDATFDTTGRVLTLPKVGGGSTSVVIPRGTSSGAEGITALSSSRSGNLLTVSGDNGSSTTISIRDADSANIVLFSDTTTILAGRWLPNRSADSIRVLRTLINTKGTGNGTVTSIATNTGSGITGGTITSTGTIAADTTTVLSTKANVTASLLGYTTIARFLDSLTNVQARIQTKQPLGNYLTFADSSTILAGRWLPNRSADSIAAIRALANTKQPIGNYLTFADSSTILAGRWLPNRSADSIAAIRALANTKGVGTVTSVAASAGTGISVSGSPITSTGTIAITNTAPDQTVVLNAGTGISVSGTYPNFTVTNSSPSSGGTVTSVGLSAPTGFSVSGSPVTSSGTLALSFAAGYSLPTDANQTNWTTAYNKRLTSASFSSSQLTLTLGDATTVITSVPTFNQNTTGTAGSLSAVLSSTLGGAGSVSGILKANGTGTVSAASAGDIPNLSGTYVDLTTTQTVGGAKTFTSALNGGTANFSGSVTSPNITLNGTSGVAAITFNTSGNADIWMANSGTFRIINQAYTFNNFTLNNSGDAYIRGALTLGGALSGTSASFSGGVNMATSSGNVGIGTASPAYLTEVYKNGLADLVSNSASNSNSAILSVFNSGSTSGNFAQLRAYGNTTASTLFGSSTNKMISLFSNGDALFTIGTISATDLIFGTTNTEYLRLKSGGNFLVRTTFDNGAAFQVNGSATVSGNLTTSGDLLISANDARFRNTDATGRLVVGNSTTSTYGIFYGASHASLANTISFVTNSASALTLASNQAATFSSSVAASSFSGSTITLSNSGSGAIQMTGASADIWVNNASGTFRVINQAYSLENFTVNQSGNGVFRGSATATGFFESSDSRLKNIIKRDGDVAYFTWKADSTNALKVGYIAQEVKEKYPNSVKADDKGYLSVNYTEVLVQKVRDLEKRIVELENKQK